MTPRPQARPLAGAVLADAPAERIARLEQRVRELEDELDQARARLQRLTEVSEAKSQFLNMASHELRGPLTVLTGHLSLLEDGAFGEVPERFAGTFPAMNARLAEMESFINAMLEASRLDDDRLHLLRSTVELRGIVEEALQRNELFLSPGQHLVLDASPVPMLVDVDRERVILALSNLVNNAIKHSVRHTDVRVEITAEDGTASISVVDQGIGIAPEHLPILFTRFGRIRSDPAVSGMPGTGLGLYLAREFARAHGGDISVVSSPGAGSTFALTLPLV